MSDSEQTLRVDRWLWETRFYKTRGLATAAVSGGKIRINGDRVKPARPVRIGDEVAISKGVYEILVTVLEIPRRRGPASEASRMYREHEESISRREKMKAALKLERPGRERLRRPDKRQRRRLRDLARGRD